MVHNRISDSLGKNYKYKITIHRAGYAPVEYNTETYELAESIKVLYTNVQKAYKIPPDELYATVEEL